MADVQPPSSRVPSLSARPLESLLPWLRALTARPKSLLMRSKRKLKNQLKKIRRDVTQALHFKKALTQHIPLQSLNRTLFEYDITWFGSHEIYYPAENTFLNNYAKNLALCNTPQIITRPYLYYVNDARILGSEVVDPAKIDRILLELYPDVTREIEKLTWRYDLPVRHKIVRQTERENNISEHAFLFFGSGWTKNYYHFLIDCCARYASLIKEGFASNLDIIFTHPLLKWQMEYLDLLGISPERRLMAVGKPIRVKRLLVASPPRVRYACSRRSIDHLKNVLFSSINLPQPRAERKIYISRKQALRRRVVNEDEVRHCVQQNGFECFDLEDLSVLEQIRLFASAGQIVAPHGAGLANIVFATRPKVVELLPYDRWNMGYFVSLTNAVDGQYIPVISPDTEEHSEEYIGRNEDDFRVDVRHLKSVIRHKKETVL